MLKMQSHLPYLYSGHVGVLDLTDLPDHGGGNPDQREQSKDPTQTVSPPRVLILPELHGLVLDDVEYEHKL
ncbi:hypothetical protein DPMN_013899 [Dreissena polymorpha]|uniref:Uncharacterized protein n=1 Tax=Dreissena polymorpha TaxID=45954 RepID=A0A9D4N9U1_DREPO|nr:hypothetical protein DPMN_013899 [Dreissena polymorpha]